MKFNKGIILQSRLKEFYDELIESGVDKDNAKGVVDKFQDDETESFKKRIKKVVENLYK